MTTNDSGLRDEVLVELNPPPSQEPVDQPPPIPARPTDELTDQLVD